MICVFIRIHSADLPFIQESLVQSRRNSKATFNIVLSQGSKLSAGSVELLETGMEEVSVLGIE